MNDNREIEQQELYELQRRVARMDARFRMILGGVLIAAVVAILARTPIALSEPDTPYQDEYDDLYRFTPNTPAIADEINFNFARLHLLTDTNAADIDTNAADIASNAQEIVNLGSSIVHGSRIQDATLTTNKLADGAITASKLASGAVDAQVKNYIHSKCYIHIGWRDNCHGCNTTPATWAAKRVGNTNASCDGGTGERTCKDGWAGIGTEGNVDGNDQFYVKLRCD